MTWTALANQTNINARITYNANWNDANISADVPEGTVWAWLAIRNTGANDEHYCDVRPNGSNNEFSVMPTLKPGYITYRFVTLDANRTFEGYLSNSELDVAVTHYGNSNLGVAGYPVSDLIAANTDPYIDYTYDEAEANGVGIFFAHNSGNTYDVYIGLRRNGQTHNPASTLCRKSTAALCGLNGSKIFEQYVGSLDVDLYGIGAIPANMVSITNPVEEITISVTGWSTVSPSNVPPGAKAALCNIHQYSGNVAQVSVQHPDSTDNITSNSQYEYAQQNWTPVACNANGQFEIYVSGQPVYVQILGFVYETVLITANNANHGHSTTSPIFSQTHLIASANTNHGHNATSPTITLIPLCQPDAATHAHSATSPEIDAGQVIAQATLHGHSASLPTLGQTHLISTSNSTHAHTCTGVTFTEGTDIIIDGSQKMEYPPNSLGTLRTLVQTATARKDAEFLTVIDAALNWAALLASMIFKPTELNKSENLTLNAGATTVDITGLTKWMKIIQIYNASDGNIVWIVPQEFFRIVVPTTTVVKYCKIYGSTLTVNTAPSSSKLLNINYQAFPAILTDPADMLDFGGHDSFIVSVATGIVWAFLEESDSADLFQKLSTLVGAPLQLESQERLILEGQWRMMNDLSGGVSQKGTS